MCYSFRVMQRQKSNPNSFIFRLIYAGRDRWHFQIQPQNSDVKIFRLQL